MYRTKTVRVQGLSGIDVLREKVNILIHQVKNEVVWVGGEEDQEGVGGQKEY